MTVLLHGDQDESLSTAAAPTPYSPCPPPPGRQGTEIELGLLGFVPSPPTHTLFVLRIHGGTCFSLVQKYVQPGLRGY